MTPVTNEQLRKLLLRHLTPEEVARMEKAILTEEGVAERLREQEFDLVDDYVRGKLAEAERADLEQYVLNTPEQVESLRIARGLAAQRPAGVAASAMVRVPRKHPKLLPVAALLAAGLAAVVVIPHWGVDLGSSSTVHTSSEGGLVSAGSSASAVDSSAPPSVERIPDQTIILLTDTNRGGARPVVHLASDALTVRLQTEVPGPPRDVSYSLRVVDASGTPVFEKSHLSTRTAGPYTFVEAAIPADALGAGSRTIFLTVDGAAGATTPEYRWQIDTVRDGASR
jgi:hypothetical protein